MSHLDDLRRQLDRQARRMQKAERERPNLMGETVYVGTLGLLFVIPLIGGAYLGHWLDERSAGYSTHWTLLLLLAGLVVGVLNVYLFTKR